MVTVTEVKRSIRERVWRLLEEHGVADFPRPVYGRIPNFKGAAEASTRLAQLDEWRKARIVKVNPDAPQRWVRLMALKHGKLVVMATPRLREGFLLLDPKRIPPQYYDRASTIRGAFEFGIKLGVSELRELGRIDLIVMGSVAVDRRGGRLGKGGGYAELEYGIMRDLGLVDEDTPVATTVHDLQVVESIPREPFDLTVDIIVTPSKVLRVQPRPPKPKGIIWELLPCTKLSEIPILKKLAEIKKPPVLCRDVGRS